MTPYERAIKKIMKIERCDYSTAERFYELSKKLTAEDFTSEVGKKVYAELLVLRGGTR